MVRTKKTMAVVGVLCVRKESSGGGGGGGGACKETTEATPIIGF